MELTGRCKHDNLFKMEESDLLNNFDLWEREKMMIDDFKAILCKHESLIISFEQAPELSISTSTSVFVPFQGFFGWDLR